MSMARPGGSSKIGWARWASMLAALVFPAVVVGHQLDECLQATLVSIEPGELGLSINISPGVAVADTFLARIDRDGDGSISADEAAAYGESLRKDVGARLDGREIRLALAASRFPTVEDLRTGWGIIQLQYLGRTGPLAKGAHTLAFENRHLTNISVYLLNAELPKAVNLHITGQRRNETQSSGEVAFVYQGPPRARRAVGIAAALVVLSFGFFAGFGVRAKNAGRRVSGP